jgi:hypothetical protein
MCLCAVATLRAGPLGALYGTARATTIPRPSLSAQTRADLAWPGPEPGALVSLGTVTSESRPGGRPAPLRTQTARDPRCQWRTEARAARTHTATVTHTLAPTRRVRVRRPLSGSLRVRLSASELSEERRCQCPPSPSRRRGPPAEIPAREQRRSELEGAVTVRRNLGGPLSRLSSESESLC